MTAAHLLWHVRADDEFKEDAKLIGAFSSPEAAAKAIELLRNKLGFVDHPNGFEVSAYELDEIHWTEGFVRC